MGFFTLVLGAYLLIPEGVQDPLYDDDVRVEKVKFEADAYDDRVYAGENLGDAGGDSPDDITKP